MTDDRVEEVKKNILSPSQWVRILYMVFYAVACWVSLIVLPVIIVCQVVISLISGEDNKNLREFGGKLSAYLHNALDYLLYVDETKPWPFESNETDDEADDGPVTYSAPETGSTSASDDTQAGAGKLQAMEKVEKVQTMCLPISVLPMTRRLLSRKKSGLMNSIRQQSLATKSVRRVSLKRMKKLMKNRLKVRSEYFLMAANL